MKNAKKKLECEHVVRYLREVAEFLGLQPTTMKGWRRAGMPGWAGRYDLLEVALWRIKRIKGEGVATDAQGVPTDPRARKSHYDALRSKLRYETEIGQRVDRAVYEQGLLDRSLWFCAVLRSLPGQLSPVLAGKTVTECRTVIRSHCRKIQQQAYGVRPE